MQILIGIFLSDLFKRSEVTAEKLGNNSNTCQQVRDKLWCTRWDATVQSKPMSHRYTLQHRLMSK